MGQSIVIDIDSLVVPQVFPPDVLGTPGYIAPEVLGTVSLPLQDPKRKHPCVQTDQHALPVLLYEYLLFRHPLRGPKVNSAASAEEDELLSMGSKALFIEHPTDPLEPSQEHAVPVLGSGTPPRRAFQADLRDRSARAQQPPSGGRVGADAREDLGFAPPVREPFMFHKWFVLYDPSKA